MRSFSELNLAPELQKALANLNFSTPTEIQSQVIPVAMQGKDIIACAETGSGKTGGYGIPMVERLLAEPKKHALILAPTRELVHQIADFMRSLVAHTPSLMVTSLVGGADIRKQMQALKRRPRIVVATPGRLIDHLKRRTIKLDDSELLVLDEGDRMLDMGFAPQLDEILKYIPKQRQTFLFSATLPEKVRKLAEKYLISPVKIQVGQSSIPVATIQQRVIQVAHREKETRIIDELNQRTGSIIVFTRTKQRTDHLAKYLEQYGFEVDLIHGGRSQGQRNRAIDNFKRGRSRILCATDVAARGIDIPKVEHVINFDLPMMDEDYVHRIGRTGRNGASGQAVSFVAPDEHRVWKMLIRKFKIQGADLVGGPPERGGDDRPYGKSRGGNFQKKSFGGGGAQRSGFSGRSGNKDRDSFRGRDQEYKPKRSEFYGEKSAESSGEGYRPKRSGFGQDSRAPQGEGGFRSKRSSSEFRSERPNSAERDSYRPKRASEFRGEKPVTGEGDSYRPKRSGFGGGFKKAGAPSSSGGGFGKKPTGPGRNGRPKRNIFSDRA